VAALIVVVGDFLHKTHKFGEVVEVRKQGIDLVYGSVDENARVMFSIVLLHL
jgi:hypothetical protein